MSVDTTALTGLRGLACMHVLLFHYLGHMTYGAIDINGSLQLSLFYLLSGFSLALGYGSVHKSQDTQGSWAMFYRKRFLRLAPVYYFSNLLGYVAGPGPYTVYRTMATITCTTMWYSWELVSPYASPSWTISTLAAFYLAFPLILPRLQCFSSSRLSFLLIFLFHIQCLPYLLLHQAAKDNRMSDLACRHPLIRLPVFIMGIIAGLLQLRQEKDACHDKPLLHDIFPWTFSQAEESSQMSTESTESSWKRRVDRNILVLVSIVLLGLLRTVMPGIPYLNITTQFACVHLQLCIIVGLTRDGGGSWLSRICRSRAVMLLGKYSMSIYLLHDPVVKFIIFQVLLPQEEVSTLLLAGAITLVMAVGFTHLIELPINRWGKKKIEEKKNEINIKV